MRVETFNFYRLALGPHAKVEGTIRLAAALDRFGYVSRTHNVVSVSLEIHAVDVVPAGLATHY
jgi:hypothetical protein